MTDRFGRDEPAASSTGFVIVGMHRSGTSALAGWFGRRGLCGGDRFILAAEDNPEGYWEHEELVTLDDLVLSAAGSDWRTISAPSAEEIREAGAALAGRAASFLATVAQGRVTWFLKDPRLCRTLPFWRPLLDSSPARLFYLHIVRDPWSVARSLARRDGLPPAHSHLLWALYNLEAEFHTRGRPRIWLDFDEAMAGGDAFIRSAIEPHLAERLPEGTAIRPDLVRAAGPDGGEDIALFDVGRLYELLRALRETDAPAELRAELDGWRERITGQVRTYRALLLGAEVADLRARADALADLARERLDLWRRTDEQLRIVTEQRDEALRLLRKDPAASGEP